MYPNGPDQPPVAPPAEPPAHEKHAIVNPLNVNQPGEQMVCEIKRHPFGIMGIYIGAGVLLIVLAILAFGVAPALFSDNRSQVLAFGSLIFVVAALATLGFIFVSQKVYWGNSWVVTTDSVTQINQISLFSKRSSQLSLGNLEDITAEQNGVLAHMLNFGVLRAETAGERSKFVLTYCPNPNEYARQILSAREQFEQRRGSEDQHLYHGQGSYAPPMPAPAMPQPTPPVASYEVPMNDGPSQPV